jgi:hypothetical protein
MVESASGNFKLNIDGGPMSTVVTRYALRYALCDTGSSLRLFHRDHLLALVLIAPKAILRRSRTRPIKRGRKAFFLPYGRSDGPPRTVPRIYCCAPLHTRNRPQHDRINRPYSHLPPSRIPQIQTTHVVSRTAQSPKLYQHTRTWRSSQARLRKQVLLPREGWSLRRQTRP